MSDPEELLRDALRHHADRTPYDATPVGEVATAARGLRRRRRVGAALATAAAVAAVTVPITLVANHSDPDPAPPGPTPTVPAPETTHTAATTPAPPRIAYAVNAEIVLPDGGTFTPPGGRGISEFTSFGEGFLVAGEDYFEGSVSLVRYDADGQVVESWTGSGLATGTDGATAWTSFAPPESGQSDPTLVHLDEASQEVDQVKPEVVAVTGDEVVFNGGGPDPQAWVTDLVTPPRPIEPLRWAVDAAGGLVAGHVGDLTTAVVDLASGAELWRERGIYAMSLSPDGRYLHVMTDGLGRPDTLRDARTGAVVTEIPGTGTSGLPGLHQLVWEDATHLLGILDGDIVRVGPDGAVSVAAELDPKDEFDLVFAAAP
ncbi:MAG: hypothetical protein WCS84_10600 [Nocardioides sp.]